MTDKPAPIANSVDPRLLEVLVCPTGGAEIPGLVPSWLAAGARLIGGCCGVGTAGVASLAELRRSGSFGPERRMQ